jgi:uncharacterized protein YqgC (DUF456 family)
VTAAAGCWWRRRNAVLRQAVLQYVCRPVGVKRCSQTGHWVVPGSSRDGVWGVVVGAVMGAFRSLLGVGVVRSVG